MIDKRVTSCARAVANIKDGDTIMIGGFGEAGSPIELIHALIDHGAKNLTVVNNNTGSGRVGLAALIENGQVAKMICSYPRTANSLVFPELYRSKKIELELVPQGTLAERIRAGGAGIPAFFTPTGYGTPEAEGKEAREIKGRMYILEPAITGEFAIVKAWKADRYGNLVFRKTARNFNPLAATAGKITVVEVEEIVEPGELDPDHIHTPGIYVNRVILGTFEKRIEQRTVRPAQS